MNTSTPPKADGAQQKRLLVNMVAETVAAHAGGGVDASDLPLHKAAVAAAVYHYTVGVLRSQEIAGRVKMDPALAAFCRHGAPTAEDIARVRDEQPELLRRCLLEALSWSWNVPLRHQVTGMATQAYAEKVVAGRGNEFKSHADVEAEADQRLAAAVRADAEG